MLQASDEYSSFMLGKMKERVKAAESAAKERQLQEMHQAKGLQRWSSGMQRQGSGMQRQSSGAGEVHGREVSSPGGKRGV